MNVAVRPYATAGLALLGASAIAISPLAPPMPDVQAMQRAVSSAGVQLSASVNPIENVIQIFETSVANLGAIGQQIADSPAPVLSQIIANQTAALKALQTAFNTNAGTLKLIADGAPAAFETARGQLADGDITGAVSTVNNNVIIPLALAAVQAVSDSTRPLVATVNNFAKAFATIPDAVFQVILPMTFPLLSTINVVVQATQDVYDGVVASDPGAVISTLVNLPANLVGGFLNGSGQILGFINTPGLLTPYDPNFGFLASGPISSLIALRDVIAQAIGAAPPAAAAAKVPATAKTVALSIAAPDAVSARGAAKAESESSAESTAADPAEAESSTGSTGSTTASVKATPAATSNPAAAATPATGGSDSASSDTKAGGAHDSKAGSGKKGSTGKSARPAKAGK